MWFSPFCFQAQVKFPIDYPYSPPTIRFLTKVWHPNVYEVSPKLNACTFSCFARCLTLAFFHFRYKKLQRYLLSYLIRKQSIAGPMDLTTSFSHNICSQQNVVNRNKLLQNHRVCYAQYIKNKQVPISKIKFISSDPTDLVTLFYSTCTMIKVLMARSRGSHNTWVGQIHFIIQYSCKHVVSKSNEIRKRSTYMATTLGKFFQVSQMSRFHCTGKMNYCQNV